MGEGAQESFGFFWDPAELRQAEAIRNISASPSIQIDRQAPAAANHHEDEFFRRDLKAERIGCFGPSISWSPR